MDLRPIVLNPPLNITRVIDEAGLAKLVDFFARTKGQAIGWDIETDPKKDFFWRRSRTWQFGNQTEQYVIDLRAFVNNSADELFKAQGHYGMHVPKSLMPVIDAVRPVLCSKDWLKVGVHLGFEYQNLYWQFGLRTFHFFDCGLVEKVIWAGAQSMKRYAFFSMDSMMARYFGVQIEKELQTSFGLEHEITPQQYEYAAADTRYPLAVRALQLLILDGHTPETLTAAGNNGAAKQLQRLSDVVLGSGNKGAVKGGIILGDNLREIAAIENNAIGAFEDMHVHGERIDRDSWLKRIALKKIELKKVIAEELDPVFLKYCGSKREIITEGQLEEAKSAWKVYNAVSPEETALKGKIRLAKKSSPEEAAALEAQRTFLEEKRKADKERLKLIAADLGKRRTAINKLAAKCEGDALINYKSGKQLLGVLTGIRGLSSLTDTEDETLEKYADKHPVMAALRTYRSLSKEIGTYGDAWATQWATKPCKKEGWLHPGDGRLHCTFNQYDAETGRSTSEKPNGQNLPKDKSVRACFIADPADENIRISDCCDADTIWRFQPLNADVPDGTGMAWHECLTCNQRCTTHAEEYVIVTADMSGAELRIIAELAKDPVWIEAFARGEDVHSVGTEILYAEKWPTLALPDCGYFKPHTAETVAKNSLRVLGTPQREKCDCPEHKALRDDNKSTNFLLAYGGGPFTLAARIKKSVDACKALMALHKFKFPNIWAYLEKSGNDAKLLKKAFDMFGRRRLFPEPTWERATFKAKEDREEKLQFAEDEQQRNIANFTQENGRAPAGDIDEIDSEMYTLTHREPNSKEIGNAYQALYSTIERAGKNHCIQGTNASIAKLAFGCGYDADGTPYLWHTLPLYKARLLKFVHDELVIQCPKRYSSIVVGLVGDAFRRAAAAKMKHVVMEFDANIASYWKK